MWNKCRDSAMQPRAKTKKVKEESGLLRQGATRVWRQKRRKRCHETAKRETHTLPKVRGESSESSEDEVPLPSSQKIDLNTCASIPSEEDSGSDLPSAQLPAPCPMRGKRWLSHISSEYGVNVSEDQIFLARMSVPKTYFDVTQSLEKLFSVPVRGERKPKKRKRKHQSNIKAHYFDFPFLEKWGLNSKSYQDSLNECIMEAFLKHLALSTMGTVPEPLYLEDEDITPLTEDEGSRDGDGVRLVSNSRLIYVEEETKHKMEDSPLESEENLVENVDGDFGDGEAPEDVSGVKVDDYDEETHDMTKKKRKLDHNPSEMLKGHDGVDKLSKRMKETGEEFVEETSESVLVDDDVTQKKKEAPEVDSGLVSVKSDD